jgi:hypothetical protein
VAEGLLNPLPSGGHMVRAFTVDDMCDAIELRGMLEGMAARFAAERGAGAPGRCAAPVSGSNRSNRFDNRRSMPPMKKST